MKYSIIGSGNIGTALARIFAHKKIRVAIANSRGPETLASLTKEIGPSVIPKSLQEALEADLIFLAVPFSAYKDVAKQFKNWKGKIVIDVTNAYGIPPGRLGNIPSSAAVSQAFPGARLVKGFNHLVAQTLAEDPEVDGWRRVVFLSSDNESAADQVAALAEQLGFAPVNLGRLAEGGLLIQARGNSWGPLIFQELYKKGK